MRARVRVDVRWVFVSLFFFPSVLILISLVDMVCGLHSQCGEQSRCMA